MMLKEEHRKLARNNLENRNSSQILYKILNCEEPKKLLEVETNTKILSKPTDPPIFQEMIQAIKEMKNYKLVAKIQIFAEMWKNANHNSLIELRSHLNKVWNSEKLPEH